MPISQGEVEGYITMLYGNRSNGFIISQAFTGQDNNDLEAYLEHVNERLINIKEQPNGNNNPDTEFYEKLIILIKKELNSKPPSRSSSAMPMPPRLTRHSARRRRSRSRSRSPIRRSRSRSTSRRSTSRRSRSGNSGSPTRTRLPNNPARGGRKNRTKRR